jgi:hypothetical protein
LITDPSLNETLLKKNFEIYAIRNNIVIDMVVFIFSTLNDHYLDRSLTKDSLIIIHLIQIMQLSNKYRWFQIFLNYIITRRMLNQRGI